MVKSQYLAVRSDPLYSQPYRRSISSQDRFLNATTFGQHAVQIHQRLRSDGIALHDMRSAESLEDRLGSDLASDEGDAAPVSDSVEWLEESRPFAIPVIPTSQPTPIRFFLDGAQRTLPAYHQAAIPVMASVTASAILERQSPTDLRVMPGMLHLNRSWIVPLDSQSPDIATFVASVGADMPVVDPLGDYNEAAYRARLRDFGGLEKAALATSRRLRRQGEEFLMKQWQANPPDAESWLVVDGALRQPGERTIGVVKSFTRQYLNGSDAEALFRLPAGHRSPAFIVADRRHGGDYLVWYLRFWDVTGRDPRYGLVRIELADTGTGRQQVDALSGWIYAERRPRATADSRWPTLLYPIHYLENVLKGCLSREIRDWPGVRGAK